VALHADEPPIDLPLVQRLVARQCPAYAHLPIVEFDSPGTTNAIYRLGADLQVRLPRRTSGVEELQKSLEWLPRLAPHLPVQIPVPVAQGAPGEGYPWPWSVARWLDGTNAGPADLPDPGQAAHDLANLLRALHAIDATGGPLAVTHGFRSAPLAHTDAELRRSIASLPGDIDRDAVAQVWERALRLPAWDRAPVWSHGDLMPDNLLWLDGRLSAVIDFGCLAVGDPACDLEIAWALFDRDGRRALRDAVGADEPLWLRGRAIALAHAVVYIPYYLHSRPKGVAAARAVLREVLSDAQQPARVARLYRRTTCCNVTSSVTRSALRNTVSRAAWPTW
jgi:aminoglycoside phosphotransferase (APT) family kinase protein